VVWASGPGPIGPPPTRRFVEYTGEDDRDVWLWQGHPGLVIDEHRGLDGTLFGTSVAFVAGPTLEIDGPGRLDEITETEYRRRGERLVARQHPVRDVAVGRDPMERDGWEWPDRPPTKEP